MQPTDEQVERVARAARDQTWFDISSWDESGDVIKEFYRRMARVMIKEWEAIGAERQAFVAQQERLAEAPNE